MDGEYTRIPIGGTTCGLQPRVIRREDHSRKIPYKGENPMASWKVSFNTVRKFVAILMTQLPEETENIPN